MSGSPASPGRGPGAQEAGGGAGLEADFPGGFGEEPAIAGAVGAGIEEAVALEDEEEAEVAAGPGEEDIAGVRGEEVGVEKGAVDEAFEGTVFEGAGGGGPVGSGAEVSDGEGLFEVEFAGAAVVVEAVGGIGKLLDLAKDDPGAEGVDGAGGDEDGVAGLDGDPVEEVFNGAREGGGTDEVAGDGLAETEGDDGAGFGTQDVPHFGFAFIEAAGAGLEVVGMDLDGEAIAGEEELGEEGEWGDGGIPDLADGFSGWGEPGLEVHRAPDLGMELRVEADGLFRQGCRR